MLEILAMEETQMACEFEFEYSYSESNPTTGWDFYNYRLPNVKVDHIDLLTKIRNGPVHGGTDQILMFIGSTILSSATIATIIKAWIEGKRRKITITTSSNKKHLEYEGPDIARDSATIAAMIEKLAEESACTKFYIVAEDLSLTKDPVPPTKEEEP